MIILKFQKLKTIRNPIENTHWRAPCQKEAEARLNANNTGYSIFQVANKQLPVIVRLGY